MIRAVLALLYWLVTAPAWAAVADEGHNLAINSTVSVTCAGSNRVLYSFVNVDIGTDQNLTVTFNTSETMDLLVESNVGQYMALYRRINPTATTANVVVTGTGATVAIANVCVSGADQTTPEETAQAEVTTGGTSLSGITNTGYASGDLILTACAVNNQTSPWATVTGNTEIAEVGDGTTGLVYASGTSTTPGCSWTASTRASHIEVVINQVAAGGPTVNFFPRRLQVNP